MQPIEWDKIFANCVSNERLIPKMSRELIQLIKKKKFTLDLKMDIETE